MTAQDRTDLRSGYLDLVCFIPGRRIRTSCCSKVVDPSGRTVGERRAWAAARPRARAVTAPLRSVPRRLSVASVAASAFLLLAPASPASADDIYEIDGRLQDAGFDLAYTEAFDAADRPGMRIVIDFDSDSADESAYQREAEQAAELVWDHLDGRVLVVDVAPTFDVSWAESGLPTALSFDRAALTERFGARPAGLDGADVEAFDEEGLAFLGAVVAAWLLSVVVVGAGTFFLTRARYRRAATAVPPGYWGGWTGPPTPPAAWPQPASWPPPVAGPGQWPPAPPPAGAHDMPSEESAQQAPHHPGGRWGARAPSALDPQQPDAPVDPPR